MKNKYCFQYCQKLVVLSDDRRKVFLAKRYGETDYDGTWAFIGGKMETSDPSIIEGLRREKNEEVGNNFHLKIYPLATNNLLFKKQDGSSMVLPHYLAVHAGGEVKINREEYSEYGWFNPEELKTLEPKIENIPEMLAWALNLAKLTSAEEFIEI